MRRGEVWWARLPEPAGRRPVVLVSRDTAYAVREKVSVVEVSRTSHGTTAEVALGERDGLPVRCVANADNLATVSKRWLESRIAALPVDKVRALDDALRFTLALD